MSAIGMQVSVDAAGNIRGLRGDSNAPRLIIASHLDTVPDAGAFDGILGVVMGIALAETRPALAIEVIGFSEEEGVRFGAPFLGSRALAGTLDSATLALCDADGVSVEQAIRRYGLNPDNIREAKFNPLAIACLEFHIEQGPVLDDADLPLGVVDTIVGQSRLSLTFEGQANHAGTTPMKLRRDALAAAAEWIVAAETIAASNEGLVATTGALSVAPGAGNVIAGKVRASLDVRHASDAIRHDAVRTLLESAAAIADRRGIGIRHEIILDQSATPMNASLMEALERAVALVGCPVHRMASGAGHDAMILARHIPTAMLFLRSPGGISHHPDESVLPSDIAAALAVGHRFIAELETGRRA
jgi:allantoate deiminase